MINAVIKHFKPRYQFVLIIKISLILNMMYLDQIVFSRPALSVSPDPKNLYFLFFFLKA